MRRWLRMWRRSGRVSLVRRTPKPTPGQRDAARAVHRAECAREESRGRRPEVDQVAAALRRHRTENHFAERFRLTMEGGA
jgi:hypothetical protein